MRFTSLPLVVSSPSVTNIQRDADADGSANFGVEYPISNGELHVDVYTVTALLAGGVVSPSGSRLSTIFGRDCPL